MTDELFERRAMKALRFSNPHPVTPLTRDEQARADATLEAILSQDVAREQPQGSRRPWLAAAAVAGVVALGAGGMLFVQQDAPQATAQEVLEHSADASLTQKKAADYGVTTKDFLTRVDTQGDATVTTMYEVGANGQLTQRVDTAGTTTGALADWARDPSPAVTPDALRGVEPASMREFIDTHFQSTAHGALELLLTPGISAAQQKAVYEVLAGLEGNELGSSVDAATLGGEDSVVSVIRDADKLGFEVMPATGQLVSVTGLLAEGVTTKVGAAAVLNCVSVVGLQGPDTVSLACGDNNQLVNELRWDNWGAATATGRGTEWLNACDPFCAEDTLKPTPVTVTATELTECGYNAKVYSKLEVAYPAGSGRENETFDIGCVR